MQQYDPKLIEHLLNAPRQEVIDYFKGLPPDEREELGNAVSKALSDLVCQELVSNLNRNVVADQKKRDERAARAGVREETEKY